LNNIYKKYAIVSENKDLEDVIRKAAPCMPLISSTSLIVVSVFILTSSYKAYHADNNICLLIPL